MSRSINLWKIFTFRNVLQCQTCVTRWTMQSSAYIPVWRQGRISTRGSFIILRARRNLSPIVSISPCTHSLTQGMHLAYKQSIIPWKIYNVIAIFFYLFIFFFFLWMGTQNRHNVPVLESASFKKRKRKAMKRIKQFYKISQRVIKNHAIWSLRWCINSLLKYFTEKN